MNDLMDDFPNEIGQGNKEALYDITNCTTAKMIPMHISEDDIKNIL